MNFDSWQGLKSGLHLSFIFTATRVFHRLHSSSVLVVWRTAIADLLVQPFFSTIYTGEVHETNGGGEESPSSKGDLLPWSSTQSQLDPYSLIYDMISALQSRF